jgi:hypothetical protein
MILFSLRCAAGHEIEAWFRDNATYNRQHARGQIVCPDCGSNAVEKAPMAPRVAKSRGEPAGPPAAAVPAVSPPPPMPERPPTPAEFRRALQQMRHFVETNSEHVGPRFADEARKIHRGEAPSRSIYGDATDAESEALADDGIEVTRIPWVPSSDA